MPNPTGAIAGPRAAALAAAMLAVIAVPLAVLAWQADLDAAGGTVERAVVDVGVGLTLTGAALLLGRPVAALLLAAAGVTWLLGSVSPLATLHLGFLVLALGVTASLSARSARACLVLVAAVGCAWGGGQLVSGLLVVGVAGLAATGPAPVRERALAAAGAAGVGTVLLASWVLERFAWTKADPDTLLVVYEIALVAAACCLVATDRRMAGPASLVRHGLTAPAVPGTSRRLELIEDLLRQALRDPALAVVLDTSGGRHAARPAHVVRDQGGEAVALVVSSSSLLDDVGVAAAVDEAVHPVAASIRLQQAREQQVAELDRSRRRLIAAVDDERAAMVTLLSGDPLLRLDRVIEATAPLTVRGAAARDVRTALEQLTHAREDVLGIVHGTAPADLGGGAVAGAVQQLAEASPLDVEVTVADGVAASRATEIAAFYVCSEALVNAVRHSGARHVRVGLSVVGGAMQLEVSDDGKGGADPFGSGLRGLADRVDACGGSLTVTSPAGGGTTVVARLGSVTPRSAPTA